MTALTDQAIAKFHRRVWDYYHDYGRHALPWRVRHDLYAVLVSEMMLQQTQVSRVIDKFILFMVRFPNLQTLADAPLGDILQLWQGLGYNRRARFLHQSACMIAAGGEPTTVETLEQLPGVGKNTAGAIMAYAYNQPSVFVETNIRTVMLHEWFTHSSGITDSEIRRIVEVTLDRAWPREWYWALMDYGTHLKRQGLGSITRSRHYKKQSPFSGSMRQMRGKIIAMLSISTLTDHDLRMRVSADERYLSAIRSLVDDGLIEQTDSTWHLTGH